MQDVLPKSSLVDIRVLAGTFQHVTNSYKLVFFQALLELLVQSYHRNRSAILKLDDIAVEMVAAYWYPHSFFNLSFGTQDKTNAVLDSLEFYVSERSIGNSDNQARLRAAVREQKAEVGLRRLLRFVPYRLLAPFFARELRGKPDHRKNDLLVQLSSSHYDSRRPLYRFTGQSDSHIEIHPHWAEYLYQSYPIVKGWVCYEWIEYLQRKNPNVPAIPSKIAPPSRRSSLTQQTNYWRSVIEHASVSCLYSGAILDSSDFALDHFVPWSFVCHDRVWNLLPVSPKANASKGNNLPSERYVEGFIDLQERGISVAHKVFSEGAWKRHTEAYVADLKMSYDELLSQNRIRTAYKEILPPLISLARQTGFSSGWIFSKQ